MSGQDISVLRKFHTAIRPFLDPEEKCEYFLVLPGGKRITKSNYYMQKLGKKYGIDVPTATKVRKIGATAAISKCTAPQVALLSSQMGHSEQTERLYYRAITSKRHAAAAHVQREELRKAAQSSADAERVTSGEPPSPSKHFTNDEQKAIRKAFRKQIKKRQTPSLRECQAFIESTGSSRK